MGVVYEAFDAERREKVALKTLTHVDAAGIYRLKNEFRALADVGHPNLVRLHELFADEDTWFFTMGLVEGEQFDKFFGPVELSDQLDESWFARLTDALGQVVDAVRAIHQAGKLHRDPRRHRNALPRRAQYGQLSLQLLSFVELAGS